MRARALFAGLLAVPLLLVGVAGPAAAADSTTISAPSVAARGSFFYIDAGYSVDSGAGGKFQLLVTLQGAGSNGSLALPTSPLPPADVSNCSPSVVNGDPRMTCDWDVLPNTAASTSLKVLATVNSDAPLGTWTAVSEIEISGNPAPGVDPATADIQIVEADKVTVSAPATAAQGSTVDGTVDLFVAGLPGSGDQAIPLSVSLVGAGANGSLSVPTSLPAGVTGCAVDTNPAGDPRLRCTYTVPVATGGSAKLAVPVGIGSAAPVGSTFVLRAGLGETPVTGEAPITVVAASSPSPTASTSPTATATPTASASPTKTTKPSSTADAGEGTTAPVPTAVPAGAEPGSSSAPVVLIVTLAALGGAGLVAALRLIHHGQHE